MDGREYVPGDGADHAGDGHRLFSAAQWDELRESLGLSNREFEIVQRLFADEKETAIARRLGISSHTVHTHLERLYRKMGVNSRCELLVRVFDEHLHPRHQPGAGSSN